MNEDGNDIDVSRGEFLGDGIPRTAGGIPYDPMADIPDREDGFWLSSKPLEEIRRYARSQVRVNPWALLDVVLARLSVAVPPNILVDPTGILQPWPLNLYVALLGPSGSGKGTTERAAAELVPDIRQALTHVPASGEGIPTMFATRERNEDGTSYLKPTAMRALLSVPEITHLGGTASRLGSTIIPTLCSVYAGEQIGASNRSEMDRFEIPRNGYRLSLVTGVQPANAGVLFENANTGLPQRFLWADVRDPETPVVAQDTHKVRAELTRFPFDVSRLPADPDMGVLQAYYNPTADGIRKPDEYPRTFKVAVFPETARTDFEKNRIMTNRGVQGDELDAHRLITQAKVAALLAILERPDAFPSVTDSDWSNAGIILEHSKEYRAQCIKDMRQAQSRRRADDMEITDTAKNEVRSRGVAKAKERVMDYMLALHPGRNGVKGYAINRHVTKSSKPYVYDAIGELREEGQLTVCGEDTGKDSSNSWRLA